MNSLNVTEAANFLNIHPLTLMREAKCGEIPGAKIGRAWVFLEDDLAEYIRSQYTKPGKQKASNGEAKCLSREKTAKIGTVNLASTDAQYIKLLEPATKQKRKQ